MLSTFALPANLLLRLDMCTCSGDACLSPCTHACAHLGAARCTHSQVTLAVLGSKKCTYPCKLGAVLFGGKGSRFNASPMGDQAMRRLRKSNFVVQ